MSAYDEVGVPPSMVAEGDQLLAHTERRLNAIVEAWTKAEPMFDAHWWTGELV